MTTVPPHEAVLLSLLWSTEGGFGTGPQEGHQVFVLLERMGRRAVPLLADTLATRTQGPQMRMAAAWLLGRIGGDWAARALRRALGSQDRDVAGAARSALERIGRRFHAA